MAMEASIPMDDLGKTADFDVTFVPSKKENRRFARQATRTFKDRFSVILTEWFDDKKAWWEAVEAVLKEDEEFAVKVTAKSQEEGEKPRKQAIVEVMVDLLLDMEGGITVHKGLVYVLDEGLKSYPMEFMAIELLKRGADPNKEKGYSGSTPLHLAIEEENLDLVKKLLKKGAHLETKDDYGYTPLLGAVNECASAEIIDHLLEQGADVHAVDEDKKTVLHYAALNDDEDMVRNMIERGVDMDAEDKDGWTPLHEAAYYGSEDAAEVLVEEGASVNARDHKRQAPLHIAAEEWEEDLLLLLLDNNADTGMTDVDGNTPLDVAAKEQWEDGFDILLSHTVSGKRDDQAKKTIKKAMEGQRIRDDFVAEQLEEMSPFKVADMLKSKTCGGEGEYQFLPNFASKNELKKSTVTIMDHFVLGKRRVNCEIIEADTKGIPPDEDDFDESSQSLLDLVGGGNKELAQHPSIRALMDYKWKTFGRWLFAFSLMVYALRMLFFGLALLIAARPDLDNPGCYRNGWDYFRGICEGIAILFFLFKLGDEIQEIFSFPKEYFKDYYNYMQLLAVILPFLIIPFRAATTWCASTGDGYCVDPILSNSTTLNINSACITASHVQWIFASLAYMANAILVIEFLALFRTTGVYVRILLRIILSDLLKFAVIFFVALYIFVGSFYLALRAGVSVNMSTGAITSDLELFSLQTLYPWHVVFTGIRILVESGGILDGNYFANNDDGQYIGYQWFSIILYLAFLFSVIVVLLNLLIAQMSDTYTKVQEDVEGTFAIARARIISRLQKAKRCVLCKETYRKRYYCKYIWIELSEEEQKQQQKAQEQEERLTLMEKKIDNLTTMVETMANHVMKDVEGGPKPDVLLTEEGAEEDDDWSFDWSDTEDEDDSGDDDEKSDGIDDEDKNSDKGDDGEDDEQSDNGDDVGSIGE